MTKKIGNIDLYIRILIYVLYILSVNSAIAFSPEKCTFEISVNDEIIPYRVMSAFVLPREIVTIEISPQNRNDVFICEVPHVNLMHSSSFQWKLQMPQERGNYLLRIIRTARPDTLRLNLVVLIPFSELKKEYLNGYRIGHYPQVAFESSRHYTSPKGFIEVTASNQDMFLSPHFTLRRFLCKQPGDFPGFIILQERLLLKLERILEEVNAQGYHCETFNILSGYRTPHYNLSIGNVKYSRHIWGDAADIFIDENPKDDMMDDVNGDGKIDMGDANWLYNLIENMKFEGRFIGGMGKYPSNDSHGPFVHIDVRGYRARWAN